MIYKKEIEGIIFDLDGTMVDSLGMWSNLDGLYLEARNIKVPEHLGRSIEGLSFNETAAYFKKEFELVESVEEIVDHWHEHIEEVYPFLPFKNGVREFLERRVAEGFKIALATSNSKKLACQVLREQDVLSYFDAVVSSDDVGRGKPNPDVFLEAAARLGLRPASCLVLEDTLMGVKGAKSAGMTTIAIYDFHNRKRWEEILNLADFAVEDYSEIEELLI